MFQKSFKKSILTTSAVGGVMVASLLTAPVTTTATVTNMACGGYQSGVATTTGLHLKRTIGKRGFNNKATAHVRSAAGDPEGFVRITVVDVKSKVKKLHGNNKAHIRFGKKLKPGTYQVVAKFPRQKCFKKSVSKSKFYTVKRRR